MKKILCFLSSIAIFMGLNLSALAETVVLAPEDVSDAELKTSKIVNGLNASQWAIVIIGVVVVFFALIIFINKQRDKKQSKD